MPITIMRRSDGPVLGFAVSGDVTRGDYDVLTPAVADAVDRHGSIRLLLDLTELHAEKVEAWGADLRFGHEYHDKIERLAIVGNKRWEQHLTRLSTPFFAKEAAYFGNEDDAWAWLAG